MEGGFQSHKEAVMVIKGGTEGRGASEKHVRSQGFWSQLFGLLEMAGRGASMAPFVGEREMRIVVRGEQ